MPIETGLGLVVKPLALDYNSDVQKGHPLHTRLDEETCAVVY
jgi:hypothetical protein